MRKHFLAADAAETPADGINFRPMAPQPADVVVYYNGTFVHRHNGAQARMTSLLRYLVQSGGRVTLFSFDNHPTEPWTDIARAEFARQFPSVRLVLDRQTALMRRVTSLKNALTAFFPTSAARVLDWRIKGASPNYEALLAEQPDAVWIVNYTDGLTQLNGMPPKTIVETHDIKFIGAAKKDNKAPVHLRSLLRQRSEMSVLDHAAAVVAISPVEAGFFRAMLNGPEVFYVPQYHRAIVTPAQPLASYRYDLLFVGSEMFQNARGLMAFFRDHSEWLDGVRIAVAGKVGEDAEVRAFAEYHGNVDLLGFVDDLPGLYASAKAAISPVDGTGLKIKTVEALSHGRPVFASRHSMEGLAPGFEACVFPIEKAGMEALLRDDNRLSEAQARARAYADSLGDAGDLEGFRTFFQHASAVSRNLTQTGRRWGLKAACLCAVSLPQGLDLLNALAHAA